MNNLSVKDIGSSYTPKTSLNFPAGVSVGWRGLAANKVEHWPRIQRGEATCEPVLT